jgi:hypothetical protein
VSSDQAADEPTLAEVQRAFPRWCCWRGISGLYYAGRDDGLRQAAAEVTGEDPLDLRDQIRRAEALDEQ